MKKQNKTVAIITARGGSKRVKNKNIILFFGKPMIAHSIICAKKTKLFDEIFVSTDSEEIKKISIQYGAKVPFLREAKLSDDITGTHEVIKSFLKKLKKNFRYVCCVYPTAPLMRPKDLMKGYEMLKKNNSKYIFSANLSRSLNSKLFKRNERMFEDSGQFYWGSNDIWKKNSNILNKSSMIVKIPKIYAQDLNTLKDLKILKDKKIKIHKKYD